MAEVFPEYWQSVPIGFELIFAGKLWYGEEQKDQAVDGESDSLATPVHNV